jgi:hypothetical protein
MLLNITVSGLHQHPMKSSQSLRLSLNFGFWPISKLGISEACPYALASFSASLQSSPTFDFLLCGFF